MKITYPTEERIDRIRRMKQAISYLAALASNVKLLWACACRWEGWELDTTNPARTFSVDNPFVSRLTLAYGRLWQHRGEFQQGGLCAIEIQPLEEVCP